MKETKDLGAWKIHFDWLPLAWQGAYLRRADHPEAASIPHVRFKFVKHSGSFAYFDSDLGTIAYNKEKIPIFRLHPWTCTVAVTTAGKGID